MKQKKLLMLVGTGVIVLLLVAVGLLSWKLMQNTDKDESAKAKETSERIIDKVSKLYMVPESEEPTVALIQDKSKLADQEFFNNAQDGDYLLVYQEGKIAMVYRENDNKLVNVGPVSFDKDNEKPQTAGAKTESPGLDTQ